MAKGKTHDRINLTLGSIATGLLIGFENNFLIVAGFIFGFLLATLIVSPDLDLGPKKRTRLLQFFLYPYSLLFKHRGLSHSLLFGTVTRVFYGLLVFILSIFVLSKMNYIQIDIVDVYGSLSSFLMQYDYSQTSYKFLTWTYLGMFLADLFHITIDRMTTKWGKIRRIIF